MRDERFIAVHRGGPLTLERHRLLAMWSAECADHVLSLFTSHKPTDHRPQAAIDVARAWSHGEITVGTARTAAVAAHAAAREVDSDAARYAARAAGHAVATAHMADHAPGAAMYALKAVRAATGSEEAMAEEHKWQLACLPEEIGDLVVSTFEQKFAFLGL